MPAFRIAQVTGLKDALTGKASALNTISGADGIAGGGTLNESRTLRLTGNALALHALAENGFVVKTANGVLSARSLEIANPTRLAIVNGNGVEGNPVLDLAPSGVIQGSYTKVTVDQFGRVTLGASPSTLAGYGITDAIGTGGGILAGTLLYSNAMGSGLPTVGTRSAGTRLVLRQSLSSTLADAAIGYQAGNVWFSVQDAITANQFLFFGGTTQLAVLDGGGNLTLTGALNATVKSFLIDHPTKPDYKLQYASLEGPEIGVYVRGNLRGTNKIQLPDYWRKLVDPKTITVQLTGRNRFSYFYRGVETQGRITVRSRETDDVSLFDCDYLVFAERRDVPRLLVERPK